MYKCCLCGTEYADVKDVIKCVNRCARSRFQDGTFKKKDAKYSGETTNYVFSDDFGFSFKSNEIEDEINKVCRELIDNGAPAQAVNYLRARTFLNWMEKSKGEKLFDLKRLVMTLNMYIK